MEQTTLTETGCEGLECPAQPWKGWLERFEAEHPREKVMNASDAIKEFAAEGKAALEEQGPELIARAKAKGQELTARAALWGIQVRVLRREPSNDWTLDIGRDPSSSMGWLLMAVFDSARSGLDFVELSSRGTPVLTLFGAWSASFVRQFHEQGGDLLAGCKGPECGGK